MTVRGLQLRSKLAMMFVGVSLITFGAGGYLVSSSAKEAIELKETFDKLTQPPPGPDPDAETQPDGAYDDSVRGGMDRLFETNQDDP